MWAAILLKRPSHEHAALIARHPPSNMIHLFESVPKGAQARNENNRESLILARDVVASALADLRVVQREHVSQGLRIESFMDALNTKARMIDGFSRDVQTENPGDVTSQSTPARSRTERRHPVARA
jgi:hypothetical protein